jgi:hypothetical protein
MKNERKDELTRKIKENNSTKIWPYNDSHQICEIAIGLPCN